MVAENCFIFEIACTVYSFLFCCNRRHNLQRLGAQPLWRWLALLFLVGALALCGEAMDMSAAALHQSEPALPV